MIRKLTMGSAIQKSIPLSLGILTLLVCGLVTHGQERDYLTDAELDVIRESQRIDERIGALVKAIERRMEVLTGIKTAQKEKDESRWGPMPTGSRLDLLRDVERLVTKAVSDIDDVAERDGGSDVFPIAVRKLSASCSSLVPRWEKIADESTDEKEKGLMSRAAGICADVVEAEKRLPAPPDNQVKKKPR